MPPDSGRIPARLQLTTTAWRVLAWSTLAAVAAASLLTTPAIPDQLPGFSDKLVHATMYAVLALLMRRAYPACRLITLILLLAAYGGLMELLQGLTPARTPSIADAVANGVGISIMLAFDAARERRGRTARTNPLS